MPKPLVAIVGRPNVGKSMLFNKLTGRRAAIVEDTPGVTRDRIYGDCDWNGREFELVDTGGIEPNTDSEMLQFMRRQAELAIAAADVIVMVTDVKTGVTAADQDVANMLLRSRKPVCLAVNKCDSVGPTNPDVYEFYALGLGDPIEVSAVHGHGTGDLLDWCVAHFPPPPSRRTRARSSTLPSSASRTSANPACSTAFSGRSASLSPMSPERRATPSTAILKTNSANTASSIPPECGASPRSMTPLKNIPTSAPSPPLSAQTSV